MSVIEQFLFAIGVRTVGRRIAERSCAYSSALGLLTSGSLGMIGVRRPRRLVVLGLVPPYGPAGARPARKHLKIRSVRAVLDDLILFVRFPRMLPLPGRHEIDLAASGRFRARVLPLHPEEQNLGDVPEVKAHTTAVRSTVFPDLVPDEIGLVAEAPCREDAEAIG